MLMTPLLPWEPCRRLLGQPSCLGTDSPRSWTWNALLTLFPCFTPGTTAALHNHHFIGAGKTFMNFYSLHQMNPFVEGVISANCDLSSHSHSLKISIQNRKSIFVNVTSIFTLPDILLNNFRISGIPKTLGHKSKVKDHVIKLCKEH